MLKIPEKLIVGKIYYYWSKSIYEAKSSIKKCKLIYLSKSGQFCKVKRFDLTVNAVQQIKAKRLKETDEEPLQLELEVSDGNS